MTKTIPQLDPATLPIDSASLMEISIPGGGSRKIAVGDAVWIPVALTFVTSVTPDNAIFFTAARKMRVKSIIGRLEVANTGASTAVLKKVPSGTALSGGIALHTGSFAADGTPATNQILALSSTSSDLDLDVGDSIGVVATGVWQFAEGGITVWMTAR